MLSILYNGIVYQLSPFYEQRFSNSDTVNAYRLNLSNTESVGQAVIDVHKYHHVLICAHWTGG